ncbi:MAG: hypothetical protein LC793_16850 [Thermomicrobia bacterium]|nr:hypothetical protein [Thermomicrobia bacterium]MCA1724606.1 hypothetical protein [Thermomicrobia bacterium]
MLSGNPPTNAAATFTSTLIAGLAPVNGARGPALLAGIVVQEPTVAACQVGPLTQFNEFVDVALLNATLNTSYDFFAKPSTLGAPVMMTTATTNAKGNATILMPVLVTTATVPTSVVLSAIPTAGGATLTARVTGTNLTTIPCSALQTAAVTLRASGVTHR